MDNPLKGLLIAGGVTVGLGIAASIYTKDSRKQYRGGVRGIGENAADCGLLKDTVYRAISDGKPCFAVKAIENGKLHRCNWHRQKAFIKMSKKLNNDCDSAIARKFRMA